MDSQAGKEHKTVKTQLSKAWSFYDKVIFFAYYFTYNMCFLYGNNEHNRASIFVKRISPYSAVCWKKE